MKEGEKRIPFLLSKPRRRREKTSSPPKRREASLSVPSRPPLSPLLSSPHLLDVLFFGSSSSDAHFPVAEMSGYPLPQPSLLLGTCICVGGTRCSRSREKRERERKRNLLLAFRAGCETFPSSLRWGFLFPLSPVMHHTFFVRGDVGREQAAAAAAAAAARGEVTRQ